MRFEDWLEEQRGESDYTYPDFLFGIEGDEWYEIERNHVDSRRWYEVYEIVMKHRTFDEYYAFEFSEPSTEMQEFYWGECIGKPYRVRPEKRVVTVYSKV